MFYLVDGWDGLDGLDGWDGHEKCPSNFFILCGNIDHIFIYTSILKKIVTNILMGVKI